MRVLVANRRAYLADENTSEQDWFDVLNYSNRDEFYDDIEGIYSEPIFVDFEDVPAHLIEENSISEEVWSMKNEELDPESDTDYSEIYRGKAINVFEITDAENPHEVLDILTDYVWESNGITYESSGNSNQVFNFISSQATNENLLEFIGDSMEDYDDLDPDYLRETLEEKALETAMSEGVDGYEQLCILAGVNYERKGQIGDGLYTLSTWTYGFGDRSGITDYEDITAYFEALDYTTDVVKAWLEDDTYKITVPFIDQENEYIYGYDMLMNEIENFRHELNNALD